MRDDFIQLCLELGVLRFGEFKLKSGRMSPYFFNAGLFNTGRAIAALGRHYARTLAQSDVGYDMIARSQCFRYAGPAIRGARAKTSRVLYQRGVPPASIPQPRRASGRLSL